jgi:hypothetical protein
MTKVSENHEGNNANTLLSAGVIRANTPKEFDVTKHRVTKFTREKHKGHYTPNADGYYTYKGDLSAESSMNYTEGALLASSMVTVVEYNCR